MCIYHQRKRHDRMMPPHSLTPYPSAAAHARAHAFGWWKRLQIPTRIRTRHGSTTRGSGSPLALFLRLYLDLLLYDHARPCTPLHHLLLLGACAATSAPWQMSLVLAIAAYNPPENETRNGNGVGPKAKKLTNWLHGQSGCMGKHLLIVADFSFPTYKSSSVTGNSMSMLRPRLSF